MNTLELERQSDLYSKPPKDTELAEWWDHWSEWRAGSRIVRRLIIEVLRLRKEAAGVPDKLK